jgi:hypothetical protein
VKIAIMGCIVNGPGEMADADFGYVGGAPGKINLYVGKQPIKFNIPEAEAVDRLVDLIREHGKWVEAESRKPWLTPSLAGQMVKSGSRATRHQRCQESQGQSEETANCPSGLKKLILPCSSQYQNSKAPFAK